MKFTLFRFLWSANNSIPEGFADRIFAALAHGDERHRAWLREAIGNHLAGKPVPAPYPPSPSSTIPEGMVLVRRELVREVFYWFDWAINQCEFYPRDAAEIRQKLFALYSETSK